VIYIYNFHLIQPKADILILAGDIGNLVRYSSENILDENINKTFELK